MPLQATSGAASYDGFGGGVAAVPNYIEDVFSTYLYTGTGSSQTITNNIDLSTKGGLVWIKGRSPASSNNVLYDTVRGAGKLLYSNLTNAQGTNLSGYDLTAFTTSGFTLGTSQNTGVNSNGDISVSWTFRKQPKFFDVVTYTGDGTARAIAHSLGSAPGCIIIKRTDVAGEWRVWHSALASPNTELLYLNRTDASASTSVWSTTSPTATDFYLSTASSTNASGGTFVAYLFASNAGGFGLTGTDNVISCGSFTTDGSGNATVNLGYEPQYILMKKTSGVLNWVCYDTMRGWAQAQQAQLYPNVTQAEDMYTGSPYFFPTATGFSLSGTFGLGNNDTFIYIAIRRGPMKVPTSGTTVFSPYTTAASTGTTVTTNFPIDFQLYKYRAGIDYWFDVDRLRGVNSTTTANSTPWLDTTATTAEASATNVSRNWGNTSFEVPGIVGGASNVFYSFGRAPGFFDEVCYTGTGSATTFAHNLGVVPELMIVKERDVSGAWRVYSKSIANTDYLVLNTNGAVTTGDMWNSTNPTSTVFSVGTNYSVNRPAGTFVNYLFATCPGVSKVGSYTGTGATQTISCGFTGGARFVLIRNINGGDWYVWDTARGMVSGTDPSLLLNDTAAEVNANSVYTTTGGFQIVSTAAGINASGGTYIFLAIA